MQLPGQSLALRLQCFDVLLGKPPVVLEQVRQLPLRFCAACELRGGFPDPPAGVPDQTQRKDEEDGGYLVEVQETGKPADTTGYR